MGNLIYVLIAFIVFILLFKIFSWPLKILGKLIINGIIGAILLVLVNFVGGFFQLHIPINAATALIAGFLGVPGVIFLVIYTMFF